MQMKMKTVVVAAMAACGMGAALAQSTPSKVELWGVVDAAVRHTTNEGADNGGLTKLIGGGMSQSRFGINVEEDLGGGSKAIAHLEHRFNADTGRIQVQVQHLFSALNQPGSLAAASAAHRPPGEWSNPRSSWGAR